MKRIAVICLAIVLLLIPTIGMSCGSDNENVNENNNPDTTPPIISGVTTSDITGTSVTISWITDEPSDSYMGMGYHYWGTGMY